MTLTKRKAGDLIERGMTAQALETAKPLPPQTRKRLPNGWTEQRDAELKQLWAEDLSASQIAACMGRLSKNAVIGRAHRLGLPPRKILSNKQKTSSRERWIKWAAKKAENLPAGKFSPRRLIAQSEPQKIVLKATESPVIVSGQGCTLLELKPDSCRWPIGDPRDANFHFCGGHKTYRYYCRYHATLAYGKAA